jgi:hypothetical protein
MQMTRSTAVPAPVASTDAPDALWRPLCDEHRAVLADCATRSAPAGKRIEAATAAHEKAKVELKKAQAALAEAHAAAGALTTARDRDLGQLEAAIRECRPAEITEALARVEELRLGLARNYHAQDEWESQPWNDPSLVRVRSDGASRTRRMAALLAARRELEALTLSGLELDALAERIEAIFDHLPAIQLEPVAKAKA